MKNEVILKYFFYLIIIIFFIIISNVVTLKATFYAKRFEFFPLIVIKTCIYFIFGAFLGLDNFLKEKSNKGVWKINKPKLLILGLPSLYFSLSLILLHTKLVWLSSFFYIFKANISNILQMKYIYVFSPILLGFIVVTSFYKHNEDKKNEVSL